MPDCSVSDIRGFSYKGIPETFVVLQGLEPRSASEARTLRSFDIGKLPVYKTHDFHMIAQELCWDT